MRSDSEPPMMDAVDATRRGNAHRKGVRHGSTQSSDDLRTIRCYHWSGGFAFAGSFALVQPSHASASPASYCRAKLALSLYYYELANTYTDLFASTGDDLYLVEADEAYTKYEEYTHDMWDVC
jgi:hypothetical protein